MDESTDNTLINTDCIAITSLDPNPNINLNNDPNIDVPRLPVVDMITKNNSSQYLYLSLSIGRCGVTSRSDLLALGAAVSLASPIS